MGWEPRKWLAARFSASSLRPAPTHNSSCALSNGDGRQGWPFPLPGFLVSLPGQNRRCGGAESAGAWLLLSDFTRGSAKPATVPSRKAAGAASLTLPGQGLNIYRHTRPPLQQIMGDHDHQGLKEGKWAILRMQTPSAARSSFLMLGGGSRPPSFFNRGRGEKVREVLHCPSAQCQGPINPPTPGSKPVLLPRNQVASTKPSNLQVKTSLTLVNGARCGVPTPRAALGTAPFWNGGEGSSLPPCLSPSPGPTFLAVSPRDGLTSSFARGAGEEHSPSELALQGDEFRVRLCPSAFRTHSWLINLSLLLRRRK